MIDENEKNEKVTIAVLCERVKNLIDKVDEFCCEIKDWRDKHEDEHKRLWQKVGLIAAVSMALGFIIKMVIK